MSGRAEGALRRADRMLRAASREVRETRAMRRDAGIKQAVAARLRWNLGLDAVPARLESLEQRAVVVERLIGDVASETAEPQPADERRLRGAEARVRHLELLHEVAATTAWVGLLPASDVLVSVVMPTHDRVHLLPDAIASVRAQTHECWELVIVNDGSADGTREWLAGLDDPRITVLHHPPPGLGQSAARNLGLKHARGDVIAYLDDDNRMGPEWLRAVAWGFETDADADVVVGALVSAPADAEPVLHIVEWDDRTLDLVNLVDQSAIAHRKGLREAHFDESLEHAPDWDLLRRLTLGKPPRRVAVVAAAYSTDAPDRMSQAASTREGFAEVQRRNLRRRPLRVLGLNSMFPLISETYIYDELHALEQLGAEIAWCRELTVPSPMAVPQRVYRDFDAALAEFRPDVVFMHWADFAVSQIPRLEESGLPFAVRVHSFDALPELTEQLRGHPQCVGVWSYPSQWHEDLGTRTLRPIFSSVDELPEPAGERDLVLSISAGLAKKDWPVLFEAMALLPGVPRRVVAGVTSGHEQVPAELTTLAEGLDDPPLVQINLSRDQAFALYARTAVLIYTITPETRFGMPMSIAEALTAGCAVVVPDRPECLRYAGPNARGYRTPADIAAHAREVLAGGPLIDAEREQNREYGLRTFCSPELGERFLAELLDGLDRWRAHRTGMAEPPPLERS